MSKASTGYCGGVTQIPAPSKELWPPTLTVRFDCTVPEQDWVPTGGCGRMKLIWYRPANPATRPENSGPGSTGHGSGHPPREPVVATGAGMKRIAARQASLKNDFPGLVRTTNRQNGTPMSSIMARSLAFPSVPPSRATRPCCTRPIMSAKDSMKMVAAAKLYRILRHCSSPCTEDAMITKDKSDTAQDSRSIRKLPPRHTLNGVQTHNQTVNASMQIPTLEKTGRIAPPNSSAAKRARTMMIRTE